jgi:hypothetical protein
VKIREASLWIIGLARSAAQEKVWRELQDALAALARGAQHVIATKSGHDIPSTEPGLVITAVRQVVDAARRGAARRKPG